MAAYRRYMPRRRSSVGKTVQKRKRYNSVANKKLSNTVRQLVQRNISRNIENKSIITFQRLTPIPGPINGIILDDTFPLLPSILPGNKSHQRVGQKIKPLSLWVSGYAWLNPSLDTQGADGVNTSGINLRLYCVSSKQFKGEVSLTATDPITGLNGYETTANKLQIVNGSESKYDGSGLAHIAARTNTNRVTVHGIRNLHMKRDFAPSVSVPTSGGNLQSVKRPFSFKIPLPKTLNFNNDAATTVSHYSPFIMAGYSFDSGVVPSAAALDSGPSICFSTRLVYEDA